MDRIILGPNDTIEAEKYIGYYCWFRSSLEKAVTLPLDQRYGAKLAEVMHGFFNPYRQDGVQKNQGLPYLVIHANV